MREPILDTPFGTLDLVELYLYYDGPRLFSAISKTERLFLVSWFGQIERGIDDWLVAPISEERLNEVRFGRVDLHDAFQQAEGGSVYIVRTPVGSTSMRTVIGLEISEDDLPVPGEALEETEELTKVLQELDKPDVVPIREAAE